MISYPPLMPPLLDRAEIREFLPPETGAPEARSDHGPLGRVVAIVLKLPSVLGGLGFVSLVWAWRVNRRSSRTTLVAQQPAPLWTPRVSVGVSVVLGLSFGGLWLLRVDPLTFDSQVRIARLLSPSAAGVERLPLVFEEESPFDVDPARSQRTADNWPSDCQYPGVSAGYLRSTGSYRSCRRTLSGWCRRDPWLQKPQRTDSRKI